jgi:hypothetical protein
MFNFTNLFSSENKEVDKVYEKIINFTNYIMENIIKYIENEEELNNAKLNLNLVKCYPINLVKGSFSTIFDPNKENSEIIDSICADYFFDFSKLTEQEKIKINRYCDMFKKILH